MATLPNLIQSPATNHPNEQYSPAWMSPTQIHDTPLLLTSSQKGKNTQNDRYKTFKISPKTRKNVIESTTSSQDNHVQVIEPSSTNPSQSSSYICREHNRNFEQICINCKKFLCPVCTQQGSQHETHQLDFIQTFIENIRQEISDLKEWNEKAVQHQKQIELILCVLCDVRIGCLHEAMPELTKPWLEKVCENIKKLQEELQWKNDLGFMYSTLDQLSVEQMVQISESDGSELQDFVSAYLQKDIIYVLEQEKKVNQGLIEQEYEKNANVQQERQIKLEIKVEADHVQEPSNNETFLGRFISFEVHLQNVVRSLLAAALQLIQQNQIDDALGALQSCYQLIHHYDLDKSLPQYAGNVCAHMGCIYEKHLGQRHNSLKFITEAFNVYFTQIGKFKETSDLYNQMGQLLLTQEQVSTNEIIKFINIVMDFGVQWLSKANMLILVKLIQEQPKIQRFLIQKYLSLRSQEEAREKFQSVAQLVFQAEIKHNEIDLSKLKKQNSNPSIPEDNHYDGITSTGLDSPSNGHFEVKEQPDGNVHSMLNSSFSQENNNCQNSSEEQEQKNQGGSGMDIKIEEQKGNWANISIVIEDNDKSNQAVDNLNICWQKPFNIIRKEKKSKPKDSKPAISDAQFEAHKKIATFIRNNEEPESTLKRVQVFKDILKSFTTTIKKLQTSSAKLVVDRLENNEAQILFTDGRIYNGEINSKEQMHGKGVLTFPNRIVYEGEFVNGQIQGKGIEKHPKGAFYEGTFKNGLYHGAGKLVEPNGVEYTGEFFQGKKHGSGEIVYADGGVYEGEFQFGEKCGAGSEYFANGDAYEGNFKNDKFHGKGEYHFANGSLFDGEFNMGLKHGPSVFYDANGKVLRGEYKHGKREGMTYVSSEFGGRSRVEMYKNGKKLGYKGRFG